MNLKAGDAADTYMIEQDRRTMEDYYHKHGFPYAMVALLEGNREGDRRAIFYVDEGVKQRVWQTEFVGNTIDSAGRLRTQIKSKPPFLWLFGGELFRSQFVEDV